MNLKKVLSNDFCQEVIRDISKNDGWWFQSGSVGSSTRYTDKQDSTRTSEEMWVERNGFHWIRDKFVSEIAPFANEICDEPFYYECRAIRYKVGQYVKFHRDNPVPLPKNKDPIHGGDSGYYHRGDKKIATCILYLNSDYEGGEFILRNDSGDKVIKPKAGSLCFVDPSILHASAPVKAGTKFILITSIFIDTKKGA